MSYALAVRSALLRVYVYTPVRPNGPRIYSLAEPGILGVPPSIDMSMCGSRDVALGCVLTGHVTSREIR